MALRYACLAHDGQTYRGPHGPEPYVFHLVRVASQVPLECMVTALFHDLLEDTTWPLPGWMLPVEREAIALLTRRSGTYREYISVIASATGITGEIARAVKIADLRDNLANSPPNSLRERYEEALAILAPTGEEHT